MHVKPVTVGSKLPMGDVQTSQRPGDHSMPVQDLPLLYLDRRTIPGLGEKGKSQTLKPKPFFACERVDAGKSLEKLLLFAQGTSH